MEKHGRKGQQELRQFAFGALRATHYSQLCYTSVEAAKSGATYVTSGNLERDL